MGEFSDGFLTVVAVTAMLYGLRSTCYRCSIGTAGRLRPAPPGAAFSGLLASIVP